MQVNRMKSSNTNSINFGIYFRHEKWYNPRKGRAHYEAIRDRMAARRLGKAQTAFRIQDEIVTREKGTPVKPVKTDEFDNPIIRKIKEICRFDTKNVSKE